MSRWIVLRFDAPLVAFGTIAVDELNPTGHYPGRSLLTGLFGNALGYTHGDAAMLDRLQARIRHVVRRDRPGVPVDDFHTVDLGDPGMSGGGWTTHDAVEQREGGTARTGTHIRRRTYLANTLYTVLVRLEPAGEAPMLEDLVQAIAEPVRPLFLGRKACLPSRPLIDRAPFVEGTAEDVLMSTPYLVPRNARGGSTACWMDTDVADEHAELVADTRDWANQVHTGRRWIRRFMVQDRDGEVGRG